MKDTSYVIDGKRLSISITDEAHDWIKSEAMARDMSGGAFVTEVIRSAVSGYVSTVLKGKDVSIEEAMEWIAQEYGVQKRVVARIAICAAMDTRLAKGLLRAHDDVNGMA